MDENPDQGICFPEANFWMSACFTGPGTKAATSPPSLAISLTMREPGSDIRYTLDGTVPGASDMRYEKPIKLTGPAVLRARAFKEGFTRSITEQQVFLIGK